MTTRDLHNMAILELWDKGGSHNANRTLIKRYRQAVEELVLSGIVWEIFYKLWLENTPEIPYIHMSHWDTFYEWAKN